MKRKLFIFSLLFPVVCFAQDYSVQNIDEKLKENAEAVVRNSETALTIVSQKEILISRKQAVTVFSKAKDEEFSILFIHYSPEIKIKNLSANIYNAAGAKIKTLKKSDFMDMAAVDGSSLYTDNRARGYRYYPVSYPYTIEYQAYIQSSQTAFIPDFIPLESSKTSVEKISFTIANPSGIGLRTKMYLSDLYKISEEKSGTVFKYSCENLVALPDEPLSPSLEKNSPKVSFALEKFSLSGREGTFTDWDSFGKWYSADLLLPTENLPENFKTEIRNSVQGKSKTDAVRILYQKMQEKMRYINVSLGIGGWKPMNAAEAYAKSYGDCKALTNYMLSVLKAADIPSFYTIVKADRSVENFDPSFPKMGGNHAVLCVPVERDTIWLENTSQKIAFNQLGMQVANRNAVAVSAEGAKIVKTKRYDSQTNTENLEMNIVLAENGDARFGGKIVYKGLQYSNMLSITYLDSKKLQDNFKENFSQIQITDFKTCSAENNQNDGELTVNLEFNAKKLATKLGDDLFFPAVAMEQSGVNLSLDDARKLPLETAFGYTDTLIFNFKIPEGYRAQLPKNILQNSEFGHYLLNFSQEADMVKVTRVLSLKEGLYPKEKFNDYVKFRRQIIKFDNTKISITKNM